MNSPLIPPHYSESYCNCSGRKYEYTAHPTFSSALLDSVCRSLGEPYQPNRSVAPTDCAYVSNCTYLSKDASSVIKPLCYCYAKALQVGKDAEKPLYISSYRDGILMRMEELDSKKGMTSIVVTSKKIVKCITSTLKCYGTFVKRRFCVSNVEGSLALNDEERNNSCVMNEWVDDEEASNMSSDLFELEGIPESLSPSLNSGSNTSSSISCKNNGSFGLISPSSPSLLESQCIGIASCRF